MKLYVSHLCPECPPVLELKEFLKLRDTRPEFAERRAKGYVGVPGLLTDDDKILFDEDLRAYLKTIQT